MNWKQNYRKFAGRSTYCPSHLWPPMPVTFWQNVPLKSIDTVFFTRTHIILYIYIYETDRIVEVHQPQWILMVDSISRKWDLTNDGHGIYLYPLQLQLEQWKANCLELEIIEMECVIVICCHLRTQSNNHMSQTNAQFKNKCHLVI